MASIRAGRQPRGLGQEALASVLVVAVFGDKVVLLAVGMPCLLLLLVVPSADGAASNVTNPKAPSRITGLSFVGAASDARTVAKWNFWHCQGKGYVSGGGSEPIT